MVGAYLPTDPIGASRRERIHERALREILDAARDELRAHGPSGVTMRAVARAVDMTPSGLYRHVSGRDELLGLLVADAYESVGSAMAGARDRAPRGDHATAWYLVVMTMRQWYLDYAAEYELVVAHQPIDPPPDRLRSAVETTMGLLVGICGDAIAAGHLDPATSAFPVTTLAAAGGEGPDAALSITVSALAALSGHLGFETRGLFRAMSVDPQQHYSAYVRSTMRLMGFVTQPGPLVLAEFD